MNPTQQRASDPERVDQVRRAISAGMSKGGIMRSLGMCRRTLDAILAAHGLSVHPDAARMAMAEGGKRGMRTQQQAREAIKPKRQAIRPEDVPGSVVALMVALTREAQPEVNRGGKRPDLTSVRDRALRTARLPPPSESEAERLVSEFLARRAATVCPPRVAGGVVLNNGDGFSPQQEDRP